MVGKPDQQALLKEIPDGKAGAIKRRLAKDKKGKPGEFNGPGDSVHTQLNNKDKAPK